MKFLLPVGILLLTTASVYAQSDKKPYECRYNERRDGRPRTITQRCNDFNPSSTNSYSGVCVFKNSVWQYGNLSYDKATAKHKFVAKKVCEDGITATPSATASLTVSPSVIDHIDGKKEKVSYESKKYKSLLVSNPLSSDERPILCYRAVAQGVATNPVACSLEPNESNYCEFTDSSNASYVGKWWVQYQRPGKAKPVVCVSGVKATKISEALEMYGEDQLEIKVETKLVSSVLGSLPKPQVGVNNDPGFEIASCTLFSNSKRVACENQKTSGFENWQEDRMAVEKTVRDVVKLMKIPGHTKTFAVRLQELSVKIASSALTAVQKEPFKEEKANLVEVYEGLVAEKIQELESVQNGFVVDATPKARNYCYIQWDPKVSAATGIYILEKEGNAYTKKMACKSVEVVKKSVVVSEK